MRRGECAQIEGCCRGERWCGGHRRWYRCWYCARGRLCSLAQASAADVQVVLDAREGCRQCGQDATPASVSVRWAAGVARAATWRWRRWVTRSVMLWKVELQRSMGHGRPLDWPWGGVGAGDGCCMGRERVRVVGAASTGLIFGPERRPASTTRTYIYTYTYTRTCVCNCKRIYN